MLDVNGNIGSCLSICMESFFHFKASLYLAFIVKLEGWIQKHMDSFITPSVAMNHNHKHSWNDYFSSVLQVTMNNKTNAGCFLTEFQINVRNSQYAKCRNIHFLAFTFCYLYAQSQVIEPRIVDVDIKHKRRVA